jgi:hypothetical protein
MLLVVSVGAEQKWTVIKIVNRCCAFKSVEKGGHGLAA